MGGEREAAGVAALSKTSYTWSKEITGSFPLISNTHNTFGCLVTSGCLQPNCGRAEDRRKLPVPEHRPWKFFVLFWFLIGKLHLREIPQGEYLGNQSALSP